MMYLCSNYTWESRLGSSLSQRGQPCFVGGLLFQDRLAYFSQLSFARMKVSDHHTETLDHKNGQMANLGIERCSNFFVEAK